jgi:hypothetical protein
MKTYEKYAVTLTLEVCVADMPDGISLAVIEEALAENQWSDGRYPFYREMLCEAVRKVVLDGISAATFNKAVEAHGREMVETGAHSQTSRAVLEHSSLMQPVDVHMGDCIKAAKLERIEDMLVGYARQRRGPAAATA